MRVDNSKEWYFSLTELQFQILVWLSYRLAATFAFGVPLLLLIWSKTAKEAPIERLLSIYWKVSTLYGISILFLSSERQIGYLISFIAPILMICSIWFWIDINEEIEEMPFYNSISLTTKIWRWSLSLWGALHVGLHMISLQCINSIYSRYCNIWTELPLNSYITIRAIVKFILGGNWTAGTASFLGYLALIFYLLGLLQWFILQLPKNGRIAGKF